MLIHKRGNSFFLTLILRYILFLGCFVFIIYLVIRIAFQFREL